MTDLLKTLKAWIEQAGLTAYLAGQVPDGAAFPYAVFAVSDAPFGRPAAVEITGWHRGQRANADAARYLDRLAGLLPAQGATLALPGGLIALYPAEPFRALTLDRDAVGGRVRLELRCYLKGGA